MPTYQYRCADCGEELEVVQKFSDDALTVCPNCQGSLRKVFSAVGVVFKGSGFYATDNRTKGKTNAASKPSESSDSTSSSSDKGSEAKPAASTGTEKKSESTASTKPASTTS